MMLASSRIPIMGGIDHAEFRIYLDLHFGAYRRRSFGLSNVSMDSGAMTVARSNRE